MILLLSHLPSTPPTFPPKKTQFLFSFHSLFLLHTRKNEKNTAARLSEKLLQFLESLKGFIYDQISRVLFFPLLLLLLLLKTFYCYVCELSLKKNHEHKKKQIFRRLHCDGALTMTTMCKRKREREQENFLMLRWLPLTLFIEFFYERFALEFYSLYNQSLFSFLPPPSRFHIIM